MLLHQGIAIGQSLALGIPPRRDKSGGWGYALQENMPKHKHCAGKYIGTGIIIGGAAVIAATAAVIMVDEIGAGHNPHPFSTNQVNTAVSTIFGGIGLILLGDYVCHLSKKHETNHKERFSLVADENHMGFAYNF